MPALKRLDRSATVAFCPQSGLMAAGTVAGAIDMSFSTSSTLDVSPSSSTCVSQPLHQSSGGGRHDIGLARSFQPGFLAQVFALDFSTSSESLPVAGTVHAPERFNRLAWGPKLPDSPYSVRIGDRMHGVVSSI